MMVHQTLNAGTVYRTSPVEEETERSPEFLLPNVKLFHVSTKLHEALLEEPLRMVVRVPLDEPDIGASFWRLTDLDELARGQGSLVFDVSVHVRPDIWESDEELDAFLQSVYEERDDSVD